MKMILALALLLALPAAPAVAGDQQKDCSITKTSTPGVFYVRCNGRHKVTAPGCKVRRITSQFTTVTTYFRYKVTCISITA